MKSRKRFLKPTILPWLPIGAGLIGFLLRLWQETGGIDDKGLYIPSHPNTWLLPLLTVVMLFLLVLPLRSLKKDGSYRKRFPSSSFSAFCIWTAAAAVLAYGILALRSNQEPLTLVLAIAGGFAVLSLGLLGLFRFRGSRPSPVFHGILGVYFMVFALYNYGPWSGDPQFFHFCFRALAVIALMLSVYYRATLDAKQKNWRIYTYTNQCAVFFCLLALPEKDGWFFLPMLLWAVGNTPVFRRRKNERVSVKPMVLPESVQLCIRSLEKAGFEAYVVGGCVRDHLLGHKAQDYDLCTSAKPEEICNVFASYKLVRNGEKHGTIGVVFPDGVCEITTFRAEGAYSDSRHPDWVAFVTRLEDDLKRRDFTINAMAYSPSRGLVDPYGGRQDLKNRVLRTVGDPGERFREDALRILRGVRFAARYQLTLEEETLQSMNQLSPLIDKLAKERVYEELCKFLPLATAEHMERFKPVLSRVIPELGACVDFAQYSTHHRYDVYTHTAHVVEGVSKDLVMRWAALLHDVGKPEVFSLDENGQGHFRGHAQEGARMADQILRRLKAPNALREQVVFLTEQHMTIPEADKQLLLKWVSRHGKDQVAQLLHLQAADFNAKGTGETTDYFEKMLALLDSLMEEEPCLTAKDLKVNGRDILALGVEPGPLVGECMRQLLAQVQEGTTENTREALLAAAETFMHSLCTEPELFDSIITEEETK